MRKIRTHRRSSRLGLSFAVLLAVTSAAQVAGAQNTTGFALNRFDPSERGSDWFWAESLDLRGNNRWAFGVVGDWAYKPLVTYDQDGSEGTSLVRHQVHAHLGASVVFLDRLRLAANLPILAYQKGSDVNLGGDTFSAPSGASVGDLRLGADLRLAGKYGGPATLVLGMQAHLPTGSQAKYTGDDAARLAPRLAVAGDVGMFTYATKAGVNFRFEGESFGGSDFGHELTFGGAVGLRLLDKKLTIGPEVWASTVIEDGKSAFFDEGTTPVEGIFGGHYKTEAGWRFGAGIGPGFTRGLGSPEVRTLASVEWLPEPAKDQAPVDTDGDGIIDEADACPIDPGPKSDDRAVHGCPVPEETPVDTDGDGIVDEKDACPETVGVESEEKAKHGCPVEDRDGDGIIDSLDACPDEGGVESDEPTENGCPVPLDSDGDGIVDEKDACPKEAGPPNEDAAQNGCPRAQIVGDQVKILDRIEFATGSAKIDQASEKILTAVLQVFQDHTEIKKIRIEGHTDNRGGAWMNTDLSRRRALAVKHWLIDQGVEAQRLTSVGLGPERPHDTNDTPEGRQNNRRVEFHILENEETAQ